MAEIFDKDGRIKVIGRVSKKLLDGDQVPGMPAAICHACGLGYRCMNEDCPTTRQTRCFYIIKERAVISPDVHILTTRELDAIKHAEYRRGRENAFKDMNDPEPRCHGGRDGDCTWELCPQNVEATRKSHCPLDTRTDDEQ